jgi:TatD DNase family protein
MGLYISLSGILTFKSAEDIRETVRSLPLARLLVETDAPYLAPVPHRGKRCEPAHVADTLRFLADLKGVSVAQCAAATTDNFFNLFSKVTRPF